MNIEIEKSWKAVLEQEFEKEYFKKLVNFVDKEYETQKIYPQASEIFSAFELCPFSEVKVVMLGQDPYHGKNQAHGLCFSVKEGVRVPPSLKNIYKELNFDIGLEIPKSGNLEHWAKQGILMINATFTVRASNAGSHQKKGWEEFTDAVIKVISDQKENVVFLLWGAYAQKKGKIIDRKKHHILESAHPSPLSAHRGFLGNKHFSKTNNYLKSVKKEPIKW